jgi:hypothetical protein
MPFLVFLLQDPLLEDLELELAPILLKGLLLKMPLDVLLAAHGFKLSVKSVSLLHLFFSHLVDVETQAVVGVAEGFHSLVILE